VRTCAAILLFAIRYFAIRPGKSTVRLPIRLFLQYARFRRAMTLGVRAAAFDASGRVFLIRHSYVPGWYLPGGGVELGETVEAAVTRELMEEGGIALGEAPELFGIYLNRAVSVRDHVVVFVCRDCRQVQAPRLPNLEIVEAGFFAPDALPDGATEGTRRRLAEIAGAPRSADW
jgi:8-oxo-dGTP pyrophosphatase MutT (NUDIX family)